MKRLILLCLLLIVPGLKKSDAAEAPPGQIAISPSMVELTLEEKPVNGSIRMQNLKKEPVSVKVEVYNWTLDEQNHVKLIPGEAQSLDRWLLISPVAFSLEPGGSQVIRYSIRPSVKPDPGEHRAMIYLTEESNDKEKKESGGVQVHFRYGMAVYGYSGSKRETSELESLTFDKPTSTIKVVLRNTGNVHTRLTGDYAVWKAGSFPGFKTMKEYMDKPEGKAMPAGLITSGSMHSTPILPGHRRTITEKLVIPASKESYVVTIYGKIGGRPVEKVFQ